MELGIQNLVTLTAIRLLSTLKLLVCTSMHGYGDSLTYCWPLDEISAQLHNHCKPLGFIFVIHKYEA